MSSAAPLGGRLLTRGMVTLLFVGAIAMAILAWRFFFGLGAVSAMSDGYPWGLWIAFDVVTGTAIACGGYSVALMIYILNRGQYHPLIRPALLTTALGYTVAGFSVFIDIGRWWNAWKLGLFWTWNGNSVLLEVALCIMSYMLVAWIEVSRSLIEKWQTSARWPWLTSLAKAVSPILEKALPFFIALGVLLPTMHQSSLGSLFVISTKLYPLWHTTLLPLLFLISVIGMGYAGVVLEATIAGLAFKHPTEWALLGKLSRAISWSFFAYLAIRIADLAIAGFPGFGANGLTVLFVIELALFATPAFVLQSAECRTSPRWVFASATLAILAGALYRFDVFLVAYDPGPGWHYFPSIGELAVTAGLIALEVAAYVFIVKRFPILHRSEVRP